MRTTIKTIGGLNSKTIFRFTHIILYGRTTKMFMYIKNLLVINLQN